MLKRMSLAVGALAVVLGLGASSIVYAQDQQRTTTSSSTMSSSTTTSSMSSYSPGPHDWSGRYRLTPIEHKRLRAMGLSDTEVFAVANAAHMSAVDIDEVAQMVLRGRSFAQIAEDLNIPYTSLTRRRPEWETSEWQQAVREGWFTFPPSVSGGTTPRRR